MTDDRWPVVSGRCSVVPGAAGWQAGPAGEDSCSKTLVLNAKCSVLNALHPRYPRHQRVGPALLLRGRKRAADSADAADTGGNHQLLTSNEQRATGDLICGR